MTKILSTIGYTLIGVAIVLLFSADWGAVLLG